MRGIGDTEILWRIDLMTIVTIYGFRTLPRHALLYRQP